MQQSDKSHPMRWMWYGLGGMFLLIGAAAVLAVLYYRAPTQVVYPPGFDFGWVWNIVGILVFVWVLTWVFGWGWGWRRHRYRRWYGDDAYEIIRERYARGEITKDQFEQMMDDLRKHEI